MRCPCISEITLRYLPPRSALRAADRPVVFIPQGQVVYTACTQSDREAAVDRSRRREKIATSSRSSLVVLEDRFGSSAISTRLPFSQLNDQLYCRDDRRRRWSVVTEVLHSSSSDNSRTDAENSELSHSFSHFFPSNFLISNQRSPSLVIP